MRVNARLINRTANRAGAVRAVGRDRLIAAWFQRHFRGGEVGQARVLGPNRLLVLPPPCTRQ